MLHTMNQLTRIILPCVWALVGFTAGPGGTARANEAYGLLAGHGASCALLERNTIRVQAGGELPVDFNQALQALSQSNLLDRVQEEYANSLPPGQQPEFVLQPAGSNTWSYVNRAGQYSEVCEVARTRAANGDLLAVFYARGERFFGLFESLTMIRVAPTAEGRIRYEVEVLAYPHQPVCRFVARHLRLVERFFHNKTREIEGVSIRICSRLCRPDLG